MTTIACNTTSIACDLQFTYREHTKFKGKSKILTLNGDLCKEMFGCKQVHIGFAGNADVWGEVVSWFALQEGKPPKVRGIEFLMITDTKKIFHATNLKNWMHIPEKHFAIGSGMQFALAAMSSGKTPLEAVKIASKHDPNTGLGFQSFTFSKASR